MNGILSEWIMDLEKRQELLETEIKILKDTVWRLTARVYHLEHFIHSQFVGANDSPPPVQIPAVPNQNRHRDRDFYPHIRHHSSSTSTSATSTVTRPVENSPYQTVSLNLSNSGQGHERTTSVFTQHRKSPGTSESSISISRETRRDGQEISLALSGMHSLVTRSGPPESSGRRSLGSDGPGTRVTPDESSNHSNQVGLSPTRNRLIKIEESPRTSPQLETADYPVYANEATETRELIIRKIPGHILTNHPLGLLTLHPSSEAQSNFHQPFPSPRDTELIPLSLATGGPSSLGLGSPSGSTLRLEQPSLLQCEYCHKGFGSLGSLQLHLRLHTSLRDKKYICEFCNKRFKRSQELTVHRRVHTGEKPYSCPVCGKRFSQSSSVTLHMPVHTGEKPHVCKHCAKPFSRLSHMKKHVKNIHQS